MSSSSFTLEIRPEIIEILRYVNRTSSTEHSSNENGRQSHLSESLPFHEVLLTHLQSDSFHRKVLPPGQKNVAAGWLSTFVFETCLCETCLSVLISRQFPFVYRWQKYSVGDRSVITTCFLKKKRLESEMWKISWKKVREMDRGQVEPKDEKYHFLWEKERERQVKINLN